VADASRAQQGDGAMNGSAASGGAPGPVGGRGRASTPRGARPPSCIPSWPSAARTHGHVRHARPASSASCRSRA
jgi:hypothetical protein